MTEKFVLSRLTELRLEMPVTPPIAKVRDIWYRDIDAVFTGPTDECAKNRIVIRLAQGPCRMPDESYACTFYREDGADRMQITAADELGVIYSILHLSDRALGIPPFWYYLDWQPEKRPCAVIEATPYVSPRPKVRFRGWFINDEVLMLGWHDDPYDPAVWEPAFEALLRCGGNMVIAGTGETHRHVERLAVRMGLYLTQHHAEPLGAQMFADAFPDKVPSYDKYPELFRSLWRRSVETHKDDKVVWSVGFRGQGDLPFWEQDPAYRTPEARGKLISRIICEQCDLLRKYVDSPVCCTNLYGEIMELYQGGYLTIPDHVIKIWADSGYGKMVSRRQGNHNPRVMSLPTTADPGPHGLYYHVTFHDLQASNHLTMLPNSPEFVEHELTNALEKGVSEYWIVNCGNIRMHAYMLDLVSRIWQNGNVDTARQREAFASSYFPEAAEATASCYRLYFESPIQYGTHSDEKAGEQFYHYPVRTIISHWIKGNRPEGDEELKWVADSPLFAAQVRKYGALCRSGAAAWAHAQQAALQNKNRLGRNAQAFSDGLLLQCRLHLTGCQGAAAVCDSYGAFLQGESVKAFLRACDAHAHFQQAADALDSACHGKWDGFYRNDCLTIVRLTVHFCDILRKYIRIQGESSLFLDWEKQFLWSPRKKSVMLETTVTPQLDEDRLYAALQQCGDSAIRTVEKAAHQ